MTNWKFILTDSLTKVLPDLEPLPMADRALYVMPEEILSFQLAYTCENDDFGESDCTFIPKLEFDEPDTITIRRVMLVPCDYPCHGTRDENYLVTRPGLYPDLLVPYEEGQRVKAIAGQWRSLWIDIEVPKTYPTGLHSLKLILTTADGRSLQDYQLLIHFLDMTLPPQTLIHTEWFHTDCLADYYHVAPLSERHWQIIENFMCSAVKHGINLLLTPIFTPPLDTAKGGERTTVQLVAIRRSGKTYFFDFSNLHRWIRLCEKTGIRYLEMSHLFTQWGATCAPKILVTIEDGSTVRLFGWHTPAVGGEYTRFLHQFLPALKSFLADIGWLDRTWFHISDEPHDNETETYAAARKSVANLLSDCKVVDALSSFSIYQKGYVAHPIVSVDRIAPFLSSHVPNLWAYYCTVQAIRVPNRFIVMPSSRNRILGVLLYYFQITGFLHWGFNFYNTQCSISHIDPYRVTDAGEAFPSGDPFLVYPAPDGTAYESIRGMVLRQALFDLRLLEALEKQEGRTAVCQLIERLYGKELSFETYPTDSTFFLELRAEIIKKLYSAL